MDQEAANRFINQIINIYVQPEIDKRKKDGRIDGGFVLNAFQVILHVDKPIEVRLNKEIKAKFTLKTKKPLSSEDSEIIPFQEISKSLKIKKHSDPNAAHITGLFYNGGVIFTFDFVYNRKLVSDHLKVAREFLGSAKNNLDEKLAHPFCDNLLSAVELAAKAIILRLPDKDALDAKSHNFISTKLHKFNKNKVYGGQYAKLLQELQELRYQARYLRDALGITDLEMKTLYDQALAMINEISQ